MVPLWDRAENLNRNGYGSESVVPVLHACDFVRARHIHTIGHSSAPATAERSAPGRRRAPAPAERRRHQGDAGGRPFVLLADTGGRLTR